MKKVSMPDPDYKALCAELVDELEDWIYCDDESEIADTHSLINRARAALSQPEPVAPTESDVTELFYRHMGEGSEVGFENAIAEALARWGRPTPQPPADGEVAELVAPTLKEVSDWILLEKKKGARWATATDHHEALPIACAAMHHALARWGAPANQPVPVSERWPEFSDCNPFEEVWAFNPVLDHWKLTRINQSVHTHWLPASQAVLAAYHKEVVDYIEQWGSFISHKRGIAAALRAAADQVVPEEPELNPLKAWSVEDWNHMSATKYQREECRRKLLAIAAELEADN